MNFATVTELFAAGVVFGVGPCFLFCAPLVLPYIVAKGLDKREAMTVTVLFSLGRTAAYSALGFAAVALLDTLTVRKDIFMHSLGALILVFVAVDLLKGRVKFCSVLGKKYFGSVPLNSFAAGVLIGLAPCAPFLGILTYIAAKSDTAWQGMLNGFSFGAGTFFSPIVALGFFAGMLPAALRNSKMLFSVSRFLADVILLYFGAKLIT